MGIQKNTPITLRHYQERGVNLVRDAFRRGARAPLVVAPTGAGKTILFSYIASSAASKGNRVTIVAHRFELLDQISRALGRFNVPHGLICPQFTPDPTARVQVASVQSLASRMKKRSYATDLLIVDEAHHFLMTNTWGRVYEGLSQPLTLGVTATPCRSDGRGLGVQAGGVFDEMIELITVAQLIEEGYLVRPVVFAPAERLDLSGIKIARGDYEKAALVERVDKPAITGDAVREYRRHCAGVPAVVFGVSLAHCEHIAAEFRAAGFNFQVVDGKMEDARRRRLIGGLGKDIHGLVSCDLIGEGVDIPAIGCAILLRPTASKGLHIQQVGRALRPCEGKDRAIILDHVGNTLVHGLPETEHEWSLDGVKKKPRKRKDHEPELAVRQCEQCYAVHIPAPVCPNCGYRYPVQARQVEHVDGELKEITPEMAAALRRQRRREEAMCESLEDFQELAKQRGYKPAWARIRWEMRQKKRRPQAAEELAW